MACKLSLALAAFALAAPVALAENQIWASIDLKTKPAEESPYEFSLNTELRYQPDGDLDTIEIRPGVTYKFDNGLSLSGGYLYASTRRAGPDRREHRLWQMLGYDLFETGGGKVKGRTRVEERWREGESGTGWRVRQQFSFERPLGESGVKLSLSDEATIGLNTTAWGHGEGLQENRAKAVIKWDMAGAGLEFGYLNQYRNGINGAEDQTNHHVVIGLSQSF